MGKNIVITGLENIEIVYCKLNKAWVKLGGGFIKEECDARDYAREMYNTINFLGSKNRGRGI